MSINKIQRICSIVGHEWYDYTYSSLFVSTCCLVCGICYNSNTKTGKWYVWSSNFLPRPVLSRDVPQELLQDDGPWVDRIKRYLAGHEYTGDGIDDKT